MKSGIFLKKLNNNTYNSFETKTVKKKIKDTNLAPQTRITAEDEKTHCTTTECN